MALVRVGGDEELLQEMAQLFLEEYASQIGAVRQAVQSRDAKAIERSAHSLKGSVGNFAAQAAHQAALALEIQGRTGNLTEVERSLSSLEGSLADLIPEMERLASRI
ncbi:MAG: Hpt domain-containing protein [Bryobacterales bacterium]|nr:Hpt domain-containing protein [Bryobacterales bacterium]